MNGLNQGQSPSWLNRFDSIYSSRFLALVILRHSSDSEESCRFGLHQELLDFVDCLGVATFASLKDAFLHAVNGFLDFLPRELFPGHIRLVRWIAIHATSTSFFHMIVSTSAFSGFLDNPNISDLRLAPAHRIDQR